MGRLVDIDDVKDFINGLDSLPWEEEVDDLLKTIPTAYNVEKVEKELEKEILGKPMHEEFCNGIYRAIEIVRKGGVK